MTRGLLRLPFKGIPLHRIARASVEHIGPLRSDGWGYRIVVADRPVWSLDLTNGHRFAVTVRDPGVPAALLNALRDREPVDM